ncbi:MAG: hypothetical protein KDD11_17400, partial [Acidobacteria bacterium]|nr:hypothetical protein [Acidobacteriota bacterium]
DSAYPELSPDPVFRTALFHWVQGDEERFALGILSGLFQRALARLPPSGVDPTRARVQAIVLELHFLAHFLTYAVAARQERYVGPEEWDLVQAAGHASAQLVRWMEGLCNATDLPVPESDLHGWEKALAVRETALWHGPGTGAACAARRIGQMALINAREVKASEPEPNDKKCSALETPEAAISDLLNLAEFVGETAQTLDKSTSLRPALETLQFRLARVAEELCGKLDR